MPLPRGCKIREIDTGAKNCFQFQLDCPFVLYPAFTFGTGMIHACRHNNKVRGRVVYNVERLAVHPSQQRRGFATALYERAAQEACRRRARLASMARQRGSGSYGFWLKQLVKDRATIHKQRIPKKAINADFDANYWAQVSDVFVLKDCNKPIDLSGLKQKPAWVR